MANEMVEQRAEKMAARVDAANVGLDPASIIAIFTAVIPLVVSCFQRNDEPDPNEVKDAVRRMHYRNPQGLRNRTARRIKWESETHLNRDQALTLADAMIAETLESDADDVAAVCRAVA